MNIPSSSPLLPYTPLLAPSLSANFSKALADLSFLNTTTTIPDLINNSSFIASLGCYEDLNPVACNDTCSNMTKVLGNWRNFWSCSFFGDVVEVLNGTGEGNGTGVGGELNQTVVGELQGMGFWGNESVLEGEVTGLVERDVGQCLVDYCAYSSLCGSLDVEGWCSEEKVFVGGNANWNGTLDRGNLIACLRGGVCGSTTEVNPDIGGIGVLISLLIQYTLSLLALLIHLSFYLTYQLTRRKINSEPSTSPLENRLEKAKNVLDNHLEELTSALVEFQKAQCFFAATLQIASLILLPTYLSQVRGKDQILLRLTAANAFSPVMLTLVHISFLSGRESFYLLGLSSVSFILGTAAFWATSPGFSGAAIDAFYWYQNPVVPVKSCGNKAPFAPCYVLNEFWGEGLWGGFEGIWYGVRERAGTFVWVVSMLIWVCRVGRVVGKAEWVRELGRELWEGMRRTKREVVGKVKNAKELKKVVAKWEAWDVNPKVEKWKKQAGAVLKKGNNWDYGQLFLGSLGVLLQLISAIQVLRYSTNIISMDMSFGQIVAVGIWVPVLLEYAYLAINGAKEGTKYRLRAPLVVATKPLSGSPSSALPPPALSGP